MLLRDDSRQQVIQPDSAGDKGKSSCSPRYLIPMPLIFLCASSQSSGSGFCLPDWRKTTPFFFFFEARLPFYQWSTWLRAVGRGKDQMTTRIKTREIAGQKREGEEGSKTIIFSGIQPLLLLTFLPQRWCVWFTVTYFKSANGGLKLCLYSCLHLIKLISSYQQAIEFWLPDHWWCQP